MQVWFDSLKADFILNFVQANRWKYLTTGLGNTLLITIGALIIGVIIGTILSVTKYFCEDVPAMKPICWLCDLYITVIRGIPVVVLLIIFYYLVMASVDNGVLVATLTFGLNSAAYMAELERRREQYIPPLNAFQN